MFYYPFSLTAAAPGNFTAFDAKGAFVRYDEEITGSASPKLRFVSNRGHDFILKPGQAAKLSTPFDRLQVQNRDGSTVLTGTIAIGDGDEIIFDSNVVGSVIATIAQTGIGAPVGDDLISSQGKGYRGSFGVGALAANNGLVQLRNPANSGKRFYLDRVSAFLNGGAAGGVFAGSFDTNLQAGGLGLSNKLTGAINSVSRMTSFNNIGQPGTGVDFVDLFEPGVNGYGQYDFIKGPIILDPGQAWDLFYSIVNVGFDAMFEGREY